MKKNGFTLVELLGVIILLGVLSVIVVPEVRDSIKQSKKKAYDKQIDTVITAAKNWVSDNIDELSEETIFIDIQSLKQNGFLENKKIINPVNNKEINGCVAIIYEEDFNQYEYEYLSKCPEIQ